MKRTRIAMGGSDVERAPCRQAPPNGARFQHRQDAGKTPGLTGVPLKTIRLDSLLHDIDEPEDLRYLVSHAADTATHRLLAEMRITERLEA